MVLAVRNQEKGRAVASTMTGEVEVRRLDVADRASAQEFAEGVGPVDVLIDNAGGRAVPWALSSDGFETRLPTNHLGHSTLANLLLPRRTDQTGVTFPRGGP